MPDLSHQDQSTTEEEDRMILKPLEHVDTVKIGLFFYVQPFAQEVDVSAAACISSLKDPKVAREGIQRIEEHIKLLCNLKERLDGLHRRFYERIEGDVVVVDCESLNAVTAPANETLWRAISVFRTYRRLALRRFGEDTEQEKLERSYLNAQREGIVR